MSVSPASERPAAPGEPLDEALAAIADVDGWLTDAQARRLWRAAARLPGPAQIVEIGSFRGRSTIMLARAAGAGVTVTAIDPHLGSDRGPQEIEAQPELGASDRDAFLANLGRAGVGERVRYVPKRSDEALGDVAGAIDVLYVDGAHRYGPARFDVERWGNRVALGGRMLVHDSFSSIGVTLALLRAVIGRPGWRYLGRSGSLAEFERARLGGRERVANALAAAAQLPWFVRNVIVKALLVARLDGVARALGHRDGPWPY